MEKCPLRNIGGRVIWLDYLFPQVQALNMNSSKPLPIEYHMQVYEESFGNYPVKTISSVGPFLALTRGDEFSLGLQEIAWEAPPTKAQRHIVKEVGHVVGDFGDFILHQVNVCVTLQPRGE